MGRRSRSAGISAVVGTAVAVMIFFTVMIPMWLYIQQLQTLFMDEVSRRLQFEVEKLNEELEITLTMQPPELHPFQKRALYLTMMNRGPIEITVPTLYIESNRFGLQVVDEQYKLPPGAILMKPLNYYLEPNEVVVLRAPTLRGNSFVSGEPIGPNKLPYLLMVQLSNVSLGHRYEVEVSVVKDDVNVNMTRGCVSVRGEEFATGCREKAVMSRLVSRVEDLSDVFAFNIAPGVYEVRALQCPYLTGGSCANVSPNPVRVVASSHVVVHVDVGVRLDPPRPIPLQVMTLQRNMMVLMNGSDLEVNVTIPYIVTLGNITEPLRNVNVVLEFVSFNNITLNASPLSQSIPTLSPGTSYLGFFTIEVTDPGTSKKDYGGFFIYRIRLDGAQGLITRDNYGRFDFRSPEILGVVYVCKWWVEGGNVMTACRAPLASQAP
ncbi:MAG: hypothetical protein RMJ28_06605 [Nitrososphaerota archaeon]|nr:hypothetical protein [Candidatus Calditenuaceae archaeon]MDW8073885.1 hypothetical protein [Nitrososphaerota archaeon]